MVHILSHMNPVHTFLTYFSRIHSNIIFPSTPRYFEWSRPFIFFDQNFVCFSFLACVLRDSPLFDRPNNTWRSLQVMKLLSMQSSPASRHFLPLRSKYSPLYAVLKHYITFSRCSIVRYSKFSQG